LQAEYASIAQLVERQFSKLNVVGSIPSGCFMKQPKPPNHNDVEPIYLAIAAQIRMVREVMDITQEDLAKTLGISRPSLANIEAGRQRIMLHDIDKIAKAFRSTPKFLLKGIWF
jgi:DNA-binding XRE family transcriptional regulator